MQRVTLPGGVEVSRIVYGMWRLGDDGDTSPARVRAKIDACLAQGITTFDQADVYGDYGSEALFGAALAADAGLRDRIEIVTKCDILLKSGKHPARRVKHYDTSPAHVRASLEASLRLMRTDRVEVLLLHRPDPLMDADATGRALDELVAAGKVRAIGVSNFRPWDWDLLQSRMSTPLATNQIELSLLARDAFTNGDMAHLQRLRVTPMAWSPLGGGGLFDPSNPSFARLTPRLRALAEAAGVSVEAVATAWLLAHPAGVLPVMGTNNLDRIGKISECLKVEIDRETWFELWTLAEGREVP